MSRSLSMLLFVLLAPVIRAHADAGGGIGLVLGGGGARGAAHIGVLKVLERERIPIRAIAGTSMGAIVGSLYAAGYSPEEIEALLSAVDWRDVLSDDPPRQERPMRRKDEDLRYLLGIKIGFRDGAIQFPRGAIQGQKLLLLLRRLLLPTWETEDFDALPIPFRAVGTDIGNGERVVFDSGDLALAVRASMSVPAAFQPLRVDGRLMVDGGIVANVPVDVARAMGVERLIVVDVSAPLLEEEQLDSPIALTMQMVSMLINQRTQEALATLTEDDVLIRPDLGRIGSADFTRAREAIPTGERAAEAVLDRLRMLSVDEATYARYRAAHRRRAFDPPLVEFLDVVKTRSLTAVHVERQLRDVVGVPLDVAALEQDIARSYGEGRYERIVWTPVRREDGAFGLRILPVDKGWGPNFLSFGLQVSDDFDGSSDYLIGIEASFGGINPKGAELRHRLTLGRITSLRSEFHQPFGGVGQYFAEPYFDYRGQQLPLAAPSTRLIADYRVQRAVLGMDVGMDVSPIVQFSLGGYRGRDYAELRQGTPTLAGGRFSDLGAARLNLKRDTLDDAQFPSSGSRLELSAEWSRRAFGADGDGEVLRLSYDKVYAQGRHRLLLGTRIASTWGEPPTFEALHRLGGFTNLSGFAEERLFGRHALLGRAVYYRRLGDSGRLFSIPAYVGASLESGNTFAARSAIDAGELIYAGSLFVGVETFFGPVFLAYGRADTGASGLYLNFGSLLRPRL